jgi:hypothetical protein
MYMYCIHIGHVTCNISSSGLVSWGHRTNLVPILQLRIANRWALFMVHGPVLITWSIWCAKTASRTLLTNLVNTSKAPEAALNTIKFRRQFWRTGLIRWSSTGPCTMNSAQWSEMCSCGIGTRFVRWSQQTNPVTAQKALAGFNSYILSWGLSIPPRLAKWMNVELKEVLYELRLISCCSSHQCA